MEVGGEIVQNSALESFILFSHSVLLQNVYKSKMQIPEALFQPENKFQQFGLAVWSFMSRRVWVG